MDYKQYVLDNLKFVLDGDARQAKSLILLMSIHSTCLLIYYIINYGCEDS